MLGYEFGDVVLVPFVFTDQSAAKRRPAVVVSGQAYHRERLDLVIIRSHQPEPARDRYRGGHRRLLAGCGDC